MSHKTKGVTTRRDPTLIKQIRRYKLTFSFYQSKNYFPAAED